MQVNQGAELDGAGFGDFFQRQHLEIFSGELNQEVLISMRVVMGH